MFVFFNSNIMGTIVGTGTANSSGEDDFLLPPFLLWFMLGKICMCDVLWIMIFLSILLSLLR